MSEVRYPAMSRTPPACHKRPRVIGLLLASLLLLGLASIPHAAHATCVFTSGSTVIVSFTVDTIPFNAGTIILTPNEQPSKTTPIWISSPAPLPNPPELSCNGKAPYGNGIVNNAITEQPTSGTLFPTSIPGISYRITYNSAALPAYSSPPKYSMPPTITLDGSLTLKLYYTGPNLPSHNSTLTGLLGKWEMNICSGKDAFVNNGGCHKGTPTKKSVGTFKINAIINILVSTCDIAAGSADKTKPLPVVSTTQLAANQTSGKTLFSLQLINCPAGQKVYINLNTSNLYTGANGVIANTAPGNPASGVGVQILKADGTPVTFGDTQAEAIFTGTTTTSSYPIKLYAQYYRTGTPVTAGLVKGIATYTLNYQ